jgi:lantibiotic modifying enzyme
VGLVAVLQYATIHHTNSFHDRASIALSLVDKYFTTAEMFQLALSKEKLETESYKYRDDTGHSLVHAITGALGISLSRLVC